jgi:Mg-chelatase subunit ChlD
MTDHNYTAMLLVIDRSGSMAGIRDDMIGGLTTMLAEQAAQPGILTVDIVTFDDVIEWQCSMADPASVKVVLEPRGGTALFDAIGMSVLQFGRILEALPEHARPETVQVVVVTDGQENSSREYRPEAVRALVKQQTDKYQWDFVFLGANQDAVLTGTTLGFEAGSSMTYAARPDKVGTMNSTLNRYVRDVRSKTKRGFTETERRDAGAEE